jgi:aryl-alcohol dehydrogenase-like predicted oxidoreductase
MPLTNYRTLGKSGLVVSPLALGTMTFGTARWGSGEADSRAVFNAYVDSGGNFVDTADVYASGRSEELVGQFVSDRSLRSQVVIATKAGFSSGAGPNRGGNGSSHLNASIDASLSRLRTNYLDLYFTHTWDGVTPADELIETMATLVRSGKTRYWGMSNAPAWYAAQLATLARTRGLPAPIVLQYFYSLINRDIEDEHMPLAADTGMGIMPWSPLAYGLLTGKYDRAKVEAAAPRAGGLPRDAATGASERSRDDKRLDGANPFGDSLFTDRNWRIVNEVVRVAGVIGAPPAQVALQWVLSRPGVSSTLMGVSRVEQLVDNVAALELVIPETHLAALDAVSAPADPRMLYGLFRDPIRRHAVFGGASVRGWSESK